MSVVSVRLGMEPIAARITTWMVGLTLSAVGEPVITPGVQQTTAQRYPTLDRRMPITMGRVTLAIATLTGTAF